MAVLTMVLTFSNSVLGGSGSAAAGGDGRQDGEDCGYLALHHHDVLPPPTPLAKKVLYLSLPYSSDIQYFSPILITATSPSSKSCSLSLDLAKDESETSQRG